MNKWRSPTGEKVWRDAFGLETRSCGTSSKARKTISARDIQWADVILVMEHKHKQRIQAEFTRLVQYKPIDVLDIPDDYKFMDPELVEIFKTVAEPYLR